MGGLQRFLDAFSILSGLIALGATFGWLGAILGRVVLRRPIPVADWVAHGAGVLGLLGVVLAVAYLLHT